MNNKPFRIVLTNGKGGATKTTIGLISALAMLRLNSDLKICVKDTDPQKASSKLVDSMRKNYGEKILEEKDSDKADILFIDTPGTVIFYGSEVYQLPQGDLYLIPNAGLASTDLRLATSTAQLISKTYPGANIRMIFSRIKGGSSDQTLVETLRGSLEGANVMKVLTTKISDRKSFSLVQTQGWPALSRDRYASQEARSLARELLDLIDALRGAGK